MTGVSPPKQGFFVFRDKITMDNINQSLVVFRDKITMDNINQSLVVFRDKITIDSINQDLFVFRENIKIDSTKSGSTRRPCFCTIYVYLVTEDDDTLLLYYLCLSCHRRLQVFVLSMYMLWRKTKSPLFCTI
jgi:hypothetical protein